MSSAAFPARTPGKSSLAILVVLLFALPVESVLEATTIIRVSDSGARPNDGKDDTAAVLSALVKCRNVQNPCLQFSPGQYDFHVTANAGNTKCIFIISDLDNLTIDGRGASFVIHGPVVPFTFFNCRNLTIKQFQMDWNRPPFSIGRVLAGEPRHFDLEVFKPYPVTGGEGVQAFMDYDPQSKLPRSHGIDAYHCVAKTELLKPQVLRVHLTGDIKTIPGTWILLRHFVYDSNAISLNYCTDVRLDNISIFTAPGMGIVAAHCDNVSLNRIRVMTKPGTQRLMSTTADATHFKSCKGLIELKDCVLEGMGDDAVNIGQLYLTTLTRIDDRTITAAHNLKIPNRPDPGERIEWVRRDTLLPYASSVVKSATEADKDGIHQIEFESPLPVDMKIGDVLANMSRLPKVRIANCRVGNNRARGFLLQTHDVVVENCTFSNCTSGGVWANNEVVFFYEGVGADSLTIRNNTFENCNYAGPIGEGVISAFSYLADFKYPPKPGIHRNVRIEGNTIRGADNCGIFVTGTDGLTIRSNTIEQVCRKPTRDEWRSAVYIISSRNAVVSDNRIDPKAQGEAFLKAVTCGAGSDPGTITVK